MVFTIMAVLLSFVGGAIFGALAYRWVHQAAMSLTFNTFSAVAQLMDGDEEPTQPQGGERLGFTDHDE